MSAVVFRRTVEIYEVVGGWMMRGTRYLSAGAALKAVKRQDRWKASVDRVVVTTVKWRPTTNVGRFAVQCLGGQK